MGAPRERTLGFSSKNSRKEMPMNTSILYAFWQEEDGQDLVEYSLLLAFIALAAIAILSAASKNISTLWTDISDALQDATTAAS